MPGALADLDRALAAAPRVARYWRTRVAIQANTGHRAAALESIERALECATPAERPDLENVRRLIRGE